MNITDQCFPFLLTTVQWIKFPHCFSGSGRTEMLVKVQIYSKCHNYRFCFHFKGSDDVLAVKGCDEDTIALNCSSSAYSINILHASYGSYPYSCGQQYTSIKCPVLDVESDIATKCQDYKECHISLNGSLFGYSCPNNHARGQLEVFYQCSSRNIKSKLSLICIPK